MALRGRISRSFVSVILTCISFQVKHISLGLSLCWTLFWVVSKMAYGLMLVWMKSVPRIWLSVKRVKTFISFKVKVSHISKTFRGLLKWLFRLCVQRERCSSHIGFKTSLGFKGRIEAPKSLWKNLSSLHPQQERRHSDASPALHEKGKLAAEVTRSSALLHPWPGASRTSLNDATGQVSLARGEAHLACRAFVIPEGMHWEWDLVGSTGIRWRKGKDELHVYVY